MKIKHTLYDKILYGCACNELIIIKHNRITKFFEIYNKTECLTDTFNFLEVLMLCDKIAEVREGLYNLGDMLTFKLENNFTGSVTVTSQRKKDLIKVMTQNLKLVEIKKIDGTIYKGEI